MQSPPPELDYEVVRAGAGAGKTTNLTAKVIDVARRWHRSTGQWPSIVVTTFTRKATQELRERLITVACREQDEDLLAYLSRSSRLQISTIHGILSLFLRTYGPLVGIDPGFRVVSAGTADRQATQVLHHIFMQTELPQVEKFGFAPLVQILRNMYREYWIQDSLQPCSLESMHEVFKIEQLRWHERLQNLFAEVQDSVEGEGWQKYLQSVSTYVGDFPNFSSGNEILERWKQLGVRPRKSSKNSGLPEDLKKQWDDEIKKLKAEMARPAYQPDRWQEFAGAFQELDDLAGVFIPDWHRFKLTTGQLEMTDLELMTLDLVRKEPQLAQGFAKDWNYWLVDEYQDTSPLQVEIIKHLCQSPSYVVGDPQQSIYLFRGARREVFEQHESWIEEVKGKKNQLLRNYRSTPELLIYFNDLFTALHPSFISMQPRAEEDIDPTKKVARFCHASENVDEENQAIAGQIFELRQQGARDEEICILGRRNKDLVQVAQYLKSLNIPTHVHGSAGFFHRREILDIMALLKFMLNPHDNKNLILLLRSPYCRVEETLLIHHLQSKRQSHWLQLCKELPDNEVILRLRNVLQQLNEYGVVESLERAMLDFGYIDFSHRHDPTGRREANLWKFLLKVKEAVQKPGCNLLEFVSSPHGDRNEESGQEESDAVAAMEPNCVNLMTVHASKGLKFKHIVLIRCGSAPPAGRGPSHEVYCNEKGEFFCSIPMGEEEKKESSLPERQYLMQLRERELEEVDRLLYVALTRAVESVCLCWTGTAQPQSWIGRLQWDLSPGEHQRENYRYEVDEGPWKPTADLSLERSLAQPRPPFQEEKMDSVTLQLLTSQSLTSQPVTSQSVTELLDTPLPLTLPRLKSSADGVLIHRLAEMLKFQDRSEVEKIATSWFPKQSAKVIQAIDYMLNLKDVPLIELIKNGEVEWGFQLQTPKGLIEGQIDLWGEDKEGRLWIVDYKSGTPEYKERAFRQLEFYAQAISQLHPNKTIYLAVVYPLHAQFELCLTPSLTPR